MSERPIEWTSEQGFRLRLRVFMADADNKGALATEETLRQAGYVSASQLADVTAKLDTADGALEQAYVLAEEVGAIVGLDDDESLQTRLVIFRDAYARHRSATEGAKPDGALRCVHCQLRARHSTMTDEESAEMLERIYELLSEPTESEAQKGGR